MKKLGLLLTAFAAFSAAGQSLTGDNAWTGSNYFGGSFRIGTPHETNSFEVLDREGNVTFNVTTNGVVYGGIGFNLVSAETNGVAWIVDEDGNLVATNTAPTFALTVGTNAGISALLNTEAQSLTLSNTFTFPDGSALFVSNKCLYFQTATKTNLLSDGR